MAVPLRALLDLRTEDANLDMTILIQKNHRNFIRKMGLIIMAILGQNMAYNKLNIGFNVLIGFFSFMPSL